MSDQVLFEVAIGIGWLGSLCLIGWAVASWLRPEQDRTMRVALAFPLGAALTTFIQFIASWIGVPLTRPSILILTGLLVATFVLLRRQGTSQNESSERLKPIDPVGRLYPHLTSYIAITLLTAVAVSVSLVTAYSVWDGAAIWSVKGYGIALEGTVFAGEMWGGHGLAYPLNIPLQISSLTLLTGDDLPISKLIYPLYYASLLLGVTAVLNLRWAPGWLAPAAVLVFGTTPVVFEHAWVGYANLPLACYLLLGSIVSADVIRDSERGSVLLAAVLLAAAAWTRVEGVLYLAAVVVSVSLTALLLDEFERANILRLGGFSLALASPWLLFYVLYGAGSSQAAGAWSEVVAAWSSGRGDLYPLRLIFGYFRRAAFERHTWGLFFAVTPGLALLGWRSYLRERDVTAILLALAGVAAALVAIVLYYGVFYISPDFLAWLARDFPRAFLPAALLLFASAATASVASLQRKPAAAEPTRS